MCDNEVITDAINVIKKHLRHHEISVQIPIVIKKKSKVLIVSAFIFICFKQKDFFMFGNNFLVFHLK